MTALSETKSSVDALMHLKIRGLEKSLVILERPIADVHRMLMRVSCMPSSSAALSMHNDDSTINQNQNHNHNHLNSIQRPSSLPASSSSSYLQQHTLGGSGGGTANSSSVGDSSNSSRYPSSSSQPSLYTSHLNTSTTTSTTPCSNFLTQGK